MKIKGPIVTLIVGVILAAIILIVSATHAKPKSTYGLRPTTIAGWSL